MIKLIDKIKRYYMQIMVLIIRDGWKKADFLKKNHVFYHIGEKVYYATNLLPAEPFLVCLHNNVVVSANVRFITHGVAHMVFNCEENTNKYVCRYGKIEVHDNVYIGAGVIINFGVTIGKNCIVAAGAVVTHDVPAGSVVAGIPAKIIDTYENAKKKHQIYQNKFDGTVDGSTWVYELNKICPEKFDRKENY